MVVFLQRLVNLTLVAVAVVLVADQQAHKVVQA
jgi:hypothetical protein